MQERRTGRIVRGCLSTILPAVLTDRVAMAAAPGPAGAGGIPWVLWALAAAILLALLAAGVWLVWRRRERRTSEQVARHAERRSIRLRYPVVLVHGLFGFDEIVIGKTHHAYFRGVPERLERSGCDVNLAKVARSRGIAARAQDLGAFVRELDGDKVNIVAHSMGGLDARYAIAKLGLGDRVASLITVGTPHRGTPLADAGTHLRVGAFLQSLGVWPEAIDDLTVSSMERFNTEVEDLPGIIYGSVVGVARSKRQMNPLLVPGYLYLKKRVGENDGIVPATSQEWGEVLYRIQADHWAQIGWSRHFDAAEFYATLLRELRGRGF